MKAELPEFGIGDTVKVSVRIKEGDKERIQAYEGVVIARRNGGISLPGIFRLHPGGHYVRRPLDKVRPIGIPI